MTRIWRVWMVVLAWSVLFIGSIHAQQVSEIVSTQELWTLLGSDLESGRVERAKQRLTELLSRQDLTSEKVLELREKHGSAMLIRLQVHPELGEAAAKLVAMANQAALAKARSPERIRRFIGNLGESASHRAYALIQLRMAGPAVVPYFLEALKSGPQKNEVLIEGLRLMPSSCWPAVAAVLRSGDEELMYSMIDVLQEYAQPKSVEALWYVAGAPRFSKRLREYARETISLLTRVPWHDLPSPTKSLEDIARAYYDHRSDLEDLSGGLEVWQWQAGALESRSLSISQAEEYFGIRAARQAVELDPANRQAKVLLLSLVLEKSYEKVGIDRALPERPLGTLETLLGTGPDLLVEVLEEALAQHRTAVVLGATRMLGKLGTSRLLFGEVGRASVLIRAMNYPSPRVQFAAAIAALELRPRTGFPHSAPVVQILIRSLAPDTRPVALILDGEHSRPNRTSELLRQLGFLPRVFSTGKAGFVGATSSGVVDLVLIEPTIQDWGLWETIVNFRADARTAGIPLLVFSNEEFRDRLASLEDRHGRLVVAPHLEKPEDLKKLLNSRFDDPLERPLTTVEKASHQQKALEWIVRLARGELPDIDVRPASEALATLLASPELGIGAAESLGYILSARNQNHLVLAALNTTHSIPNRRAACRALAQNIQLGGLALDSASTRRVLDVLEKSQDHSLRMALVRLAGIFGLSEMEVARRMRRYEPLQLEGGIAK